MSSNQHHLTPGALVDQLLDRPPRAGATRVVAVDGPSGSGKTTLTRWLARALDRRGVGRSVVHLDDLYPGWDGLAATPELVARHVLGPLADGRPVGYPSWDWRRDVTGPYRVVPVRDVLLLEGVASGARSGRDQISMLVWVQAPADVRRDRALARDGSTYRPHWSRWAAQEEAFYAADDVRSRADVLVDGTTGPGDPDDRTPAG